MKLERSPIVLTVAMIALGAGALPAQARRNAVSSQVEDFFGKDAVAAVYGASSVEIARLRKARGGDGYTIESVGKLSGVVAGAFRKVLLDYATYDFPPAGESDSKLCGSFDPAVVVRFARGAKPPADVILSLSCIEGGMATGPTLPRKLTAGAAYEGWPRFRANMGPGQMRVLGLLTRALPKDIDIKAFMAAAQGN